MCTWGWSWNSENYPSPLPADVLLVLPIERDWEKWQSKGDEKQQTRFCVLEVCVISTRDFHVERSSWFQQWLGPVGTGSAFQHSQKRPQSIPSEEPGSGIVTSSSGVWVLALQSPFFTFLRHRLLLCSITSSKIWWLIPLSHIVKPLVSNNLKMFIRFSFLEMSAVSW